MLALVSMQGALTMVLQVQRDLSAARKCVFDHAIIISMQQTRTLLLRPKHVEPAAPLSRHLAC